MERNDNFVTIILFLLMVLIFGATVYFCLDLFDIIQVPEALSIASFLGKRNSRLALSIDSDETITNETIDEWINAKYKVSDNRYNTEYEQTASTSTSISSSSEATPTVEYQNENVANRLYYSQLDVYGKLIYMEFNEHRSEFMKGTYVADFGTEFNDLLHEEGGSETLEKSFQRSVNALLFDNPDLFYIDVTKIYMYTEITSFGPIKVYKVKMGPAVNSNYLSDAFKTEEAVSRAVSTLDKFSTDFMSKISSQTDYEKVKNIHDYIVNSTSYDKTQQKENIYNIYGVLIGHEAVCEGYSKTMKYLLDKANIPCIIVCGIGVNTSGQTENHAWNYVKIDGKWYAIDVTWDDPVIVGDGYVSSNIYTKYFLKGSKDFFNDHLEDGNLVNFDNFAYPTISEENYKK